MKNILLEGSIFVVDVSIFQESLLNHIKGIQRDNKIIYLESLVLEGEERDDLKRNFSGRADLTCYLSFGFSNGRLVRESAVWNHFGEVYLISEQCLIADNYCGTGKRADMYNLFIYCDSKIPNFYGEGLITIIPE